MQLLSACLSLKSNFWTGNLFKEEYVGVMEFIQVTPSAAVFMAMSESNIIEIFIRYRCNHQVYYGK